MSWEVAGTVFTLPASTGLTQHRFVTCTAGKAAYPTVGSPVIGVVYDAGTTGSTKDGYVSIQLDGVAQVYAPSSTVSAGDWIESSSVGRVTALTAGGYCAGVVVDGTSGGARLLTVALVPVGTT